MNHHLFIELLCISLSSSALIFSYPLYKNNKDIHALFWMVSWGLWMTVIAILHIMMQYFYIMPQSVLIRSEIFERLLCAFLIMFCVYPGTSKEEPFLFIKMKYWIYSLITIAVLSTFLFKFIPDKVYSLIPVEHTSDCLIVFQLITISIIFGRLIDIVSKWAGILRWASAGVLLSAICAALSDVKCDSFCHMDHVFKILTYLFVLHSIVYVWYKIGTYNGNTMKQIISAHYGHTDQNPANI